MNAPAKKKRLLVLFVFYFFFNLLWELQNYNSLLHNHQQNVGFHQKRYPHTRAKEKSQQDGSVQFSCSVKSNSLRPHESQHARPPGPSQTPGVYSNSCPLSQWCHPAISSSVDPFSSCPLSLPASGSFPMSQLFTWGGQVFEFQLQHQSFQWTPRTDLL